MHTTDYVPELNSLFIFRGGDGREYLNSLHRLNLDSMEWTTPIVQGDPPLPRANHSSAVVQQKLYVFGGWDGNKRLNDIHILDARDMVWSSPVINGRPPSPRAGMTFTQVRDRIFLFGGSGPSAKCFNDLQIFDPNRLLWLNIATPEDLQEALMGSGGGGGGGGGGGSSSGVGGGGTKVEGGSGLTSRFDTFEPFASKYSELGDDDHSGGGGGGGGSGAGGEGGAFLMGGGGLHGGSAISEEGTTNQGGGNGYGGGDNGANSSNNHNNNNHNNKSSSNMMMMMSNVVQDGSNPNAFFDLNDDTNVLIQGQGPGHRAGHTTTVVDERRLFVFGGSYGTEYLNDFFILDTDPPPNLKENAPSSMSLLSKSLGAFCNDEQFSDVEFLVEGRVIHAHRVILSLLSERFRAMFSSGFMESTQKQIKLDESIRYTTFMSMLEYLYTGKGPDDIDESSSSSSYNSNGLLKIVELLQLSDQFMLDHLKQICECKLGNAVNALNVDSILEHGEMFNAEQLVLFCRHYKRNFCVSVGDSGKGGGSGGDVYLYNNDDDGDKSMSSIGSGIPGGSAMVGGDTVENGLEEGSKRK